MPMDDRIFIPEIELQRLIGKSFNSIKSWLYIAIDIFFLLSGLTFLVISTDDDAIEQLISELNNGR